MRTIKTDKRYLSEDTEVVKEITKLINNKRKDKKISLLQAGTGVGKTKVMFDILIKNKIQYIYVLPNIAVVNNLSKEKKIIGVNSETKHKLEKTIRDGSSLTCTVDQLKNIDRVPINLLKNIVLIIDEAHYYPSVIRFRKKAINNLTKAFKIPFKNIIMVTATPGSLRLLKRNPIKILNIDTPRYTKYTFNDVYIKENEIDKMKKFISGLDGQVIMYNNASKKDNDLLAEETEGWYSINADTPKNNKVRKAIIEQQTIPDYVKVLIATDIFTAGLNIKKSNVKHAILNNIDDPTTIAQFIARIRDKEELMVHYFTGTEPHKVNIKCSIKPDELSNVWLEASFAMNELENFIHDTDYVAKHAKEFELINYILEDGMVKDFDYNEFAIIDKAYRASFAGHKWYSRLRYAANIPTDLNDRELNDFFIENEEMFLVEGKVIEDDNRLQERKKADKIKEDIEKEKRTIKVIDALENNLHILMMPMPDFEYVAVKEGLDTKELKELKKITRRYEKYNKLSVQLLARIDKDKKFRDRLFYQSVPQTIEPKLLYEKAALAVKRNHKLGRKKPKFDYTTDSGREYKRAFDERCNNKKKKRLYEFE